jgi:hypothetical protein
MTTVLAALDRLSRESANSAGWIATGAIADAVGCTAGDAAAALRGAAGQGLCTSRRSLADGTTWRLTPTGSLVVARWQGARSAAR